MNAEISKKTNITIAYGDGIGPEIMESVISILEASKAPLKFHVIEVGQKIYEKFSETGITNENLDLIKANKILLKAPITTPQGGGYKSLNVTLRKSLGLYANVRPSLSYYPFINTMHKNLDVVIIRENEEDLYAGIEYRHTHNMMESLKLISRTGCEKIVRYAFEYAMKHNRKKVTCFSKDNIMKFSEGILHKVFDEIASEYREVIESEHYIIDIGTAILATDPDRFDVIVTSNLFGDIISDMTGKMSGSVGLAGSCNVGSKYAMFEAIHGSAPKMANKGVANPSGLLSASVMMLSHIGEYQTANLIGNALKKTIEDGIHTKDIYNQDISKKMVGSKEFTREVINRLGETPSHLKTESYSYSNPINEKITSATKAVSKESLEKRLVGVDIFLDFKTKNSNSLVQKLKEILKDFQNLSLNSVFSKGLKFWPNSNVEESFSDHWCCRFLSEDAKPVIDYLDIIELLSLFAKSDIKFIKVENLYFFGSERGFSE